MIQNRASQNLRRLAVSFSTWFVARKNLTVYTNIKHFHRGFAIITDRLV